MIITSSKAVVISCVGDSITQGSGASSPYNTYPSQLQRILSKHVTNVTSFTTTINCNIYNFGKGGTTIISSTPESYWKSNEYDNAIKSSPDIVIIQFGTNDIKKKYWNETQFREDYYRLIQQFRNLDTHPIIYINTPPPSYSTIDIFGIPSYFQNQKLPRIVTDVANISNVKTINIFNVMGGVELTKPEAFFTPGKKINKWPNDGCHPNDHGYTIMSKKIAREIVDDVICRASSDVLGCQG